MMKTSSPENDVPYETFVRSICPDFHHLIPEEICLRGYNGKGASEQRKRYEFPGTASEGICGGSRSEEEGQKVRRRKSPPAVVGKGLYGRNRRNTQQAS